MSEEGKNSKFNNTLPIWGNEATMNLNPLILTNIQSSTYFKVSLFKLKTYHEVIDEIYYQVKHMEPWEMGSRKTSGQGMCGGVRGVGAGGIVSSFFCLLYKLYTLKLTRKQLNGLLNHGDSPYIRALGFMYIRYTQPPTDLYNWFEEYLLDEEEIDVKAGGGQIMTIGQMLVHFLTKLDWLGTLFPRIPVPIQKQIQAKLEQYAQDYETTLEAMSAPDPSANNKGQKPRYGGAGEQGRNNKSYDNRNHRGEGHSQGRGGGGGGSAHRREDEGRARNYHQDDRHSSSSSSHRGPSKYSRSRSRSRSPPRSKYYDKDWAGGSSSDRYRRSPSPEDRYSSYGRRGGSDRGRDDYYERDRESHKSHRRKY